MSPEQTELPYQIDMVTGIIHDAAHVKEACGLADRNESQLMRGKNLESLQKAGLLLCDRCFAGLAGRTRPKP